MTELRVMAVSSDGTRLVLRSSDGQEFHVPIDERLRAAVRGDRARLGQIEIEAEGQLRPRDIQTRIRAGATAQEVADASGIPVERIKRFEGPVLAERAFMAEKAQNTQVRRQGESHGLKLGEIVQERLTKRGADDPSAVHWDSWRREDGTWTVQALYRISGEPYEALWAFDPPRRLVTPEDDEARLLSSDAATLAAEPMFPFAASVLSGGSVLPGPANGSSGSSAGGSVVHLGARRRQDADRGERERTASVERHPSSAAAMSVPSAPAPLPTPTVGVDDFDFLDVAANGDARTPVAAAAGGGQPAGSAFDDALFGPRTTTPHRERMVGTTDRQAEADGVRPGRRATVPSWDEIVFGSRRGKKGREG